MDGPTADDIVETLRRTYPTWDSIDEDVAFSQLDDEPLSRCGVLMAFKFKVNDWIKEDDPASIRKAMDIIDDLLAHTAPLPRGSTSEAFQTNLYNDIWTCFVEGVGTGPAEVIAVVLPLARGERVTALFDRELLAWGVDRNAG